MQLSPFEFAVYTWKTHDGAPSFVDANWTVNVYDVCQLHTSGHIGGSHVCKRYVIGGALYSRRTLVSRLSMLGSIHHSLGLICSVSFWLLPSSLCFSIFRHRTMYNNGTCRSTVTVDSRIGRAVSLWFVHRGKVIGGTVTS